MRNRPDYIQAIVDSHDILEYLTYRGYDYKSTNGDRYKYICPFHEEKEPSFYVFTSGNPHFYCFGCKVGGDIINLVSEMEQISLKATIRKLATAAGISPEDAVEYEAIRAEKNKERYDDAKVDDLSFKLSVTLYGYLKQVNFDRDEIIFVEKSYEKIDKIIHAMDSVELQKVYDYIVDYGIRARMKDWTSLQELKSISITGHD